MSERQPGPGAEDEGEYTDSEDAAGRREEPPSEPSGSYVDVDETHVASGVEGQYPDRDGHHVPDQEDKGSYTDSER